MSDNIIIACDIFSLGLLAFFIFLIAKKQSGSPAYGFKECLLLICLFITITTADLAGLFVDGTARTVFEIIKITVSSLFLAILPFFIVNAFESRRRLKAIKYSALAGGLLYAALMSVNPSAAFYSSSAEAGAQGLYYVTYDYTLAGKIFFAIPMLLSALCFILLMAKGFMPAAAFKFRIYTAAALLLVLVSSVLKITGVTQFDYTAAASALPAFFLTLAFIKYAQTDSAAHTRKNLFNMLSDALIVMDTNRNIVLINASAERVFGLRQEQVRNKPFGILAEGLPDYSKFNLEYMELQMNRSGIPQFYEFRRIPLTSNVALSGYLLMIKNITKEKALQRKLNYLSECDPVTGLLNHNSLIRVIIDHADAAGLKGTRFISICISNIDAIRQTVAPAQEQEIFRLTAEYLKKFMLPESHLACFGGHEFFVFDKKNILTPALIRVKAKSAPPLIYNTETSECRIELKVGLFIPQNNIRPEDGINHASFALKMALAGKDFLYCYDDNAEMRHNLLKGLIRCIQQPEKWFHMEYQPVIDIAANKIIGAEALLRWRHPEYGNISPALFIPIAESAGLMVAIGKFVTDSVCKFVSTWEDIPQRFKMAFNISKKQIDEPDFAANLLEIVNGYAIRHDQLEIEITETAVSDNADKMPAFCRSMKSAGIRISIDDFGSGNTALAYISDWQCDTLKLDAAMSADAMNNERKMQILSSIVTMCESMNVDLIIEHIDNMKAVEFFRDMGFKQVQGYVFARPMTGQALKNFHKDFVSNKTIFLAPNTEAAGSI